MNSTVKKSLLAALVLGLFSVLGTGLVKLTFDNTKAKIAENERAALLRSLSAIVPSNTYDNDIVSDTLELDAAVLGGQKPMVLYRARNKQLPVAVVFSTIAPEGYNGQIKLLVAVDTQGAVLGVRVVAHKETPGLGDAIEQARSNWILGFTGKSLSHMSAKQWGVKRDGGDFDQFTGATITPRAVVKAVKNTLVFFHENPKRLFSKPEVIKPIAAVATKTNKVKTDKQP